MREPGMIEVRCPALLDGTTPLDEIVGQGVDIHLEQMSDTCWWMAIYGKDKTITVRLHTRRAPIMATWDDDEPLEPAMNLPTTGTEPLKIPEIPVGIGGNPVTAIDLVTLDGTVLRFKLPSVQQSRFMWGLGKLLYSLDVPVEVVFPEVVEIEPEKTMGD